MEQAAVVRHVKHGHEPETPWVAAFALAFVDQHRNVPVYFFGQLSVLAGTENWARAGVRIK
jgi:hypothetical protein